MTTISSSTTSTTAYKVTADTTGALVLQTGATPTTAVTVDASQNVGIGTTSPSSYGLLSVVSSTAGSAKISIQDTSGGASPAPLLQFGVNSSNGFNTSDAARVWTTAPLSTTASLNFAAYSGGAPSTAQMTLTGGNVGIGTSSITQAFANYTQLNISGSSGATIQMQTGSTTRANIVSDANALYIAQLAGNMQFAVGGTGTGTNRMTIDSNGYVLNAVNGNSNGLHQAYQYYRLNTAIVGTQATTAQSIFNVGVTLVGSTVYEFEIAIAMTKTAGTTSHTISTGFGGTATINNIYYDSLEADATGAMNTRLSAANSQTPVSTVAATVVTASMSATTQAVALVLKGTVSINAGGTFIPQYTLSAAPGGAYTVQIGGYMKIAALGAAGSNISIGTWA